MAKHLSTYSLLSIILLLTSCSQEEIDPKIDHSDRGQRIEFRASMPEITSRATEVNTGNLERFQVSSFTVGASSLSAYFLDRTFGKNAVTGTYFSSDPECIWPNNNDEIRFVAFAPSCEEMRTAGGFSPTDLSLTPLSETEAITDSYKISPFKIARDIASQVDFMTAKGSGTLLVNEDKPIDLTLQHQLSRIELKAFGNSPSFRIEIAGVRFGGVATESVFDFSTASYDAASPDAGSWESVTKGEVEYIFRAGDQLVVLDKSEDSPTTADKAVSILGSKVGEGTDTYDNSAMVIPSVNPAWNYKDNADNGSSHNDGLYVSVLMRVTDVTPYAPAAPDNIVYPYADNKEGMEVIYLAVDTLTKKAVKTRLYLYEGEYYTDEGHTQKYDLAANSAEAQTFGWAALPVEANWQPGLLYAYTLNYTSGVGLRNPRDPQPGKPIINDRVLIKVDVKPWGPSQNSDVTVPRK